MVKDLPNNTVIPWDNILNELNIPIKRGYYILEKWNKIGMLNYGVSLRTSWIEDKSKWKP